MSEITILFCRADSVYKGLPGCEVYDASRDARTWPGGTPVVAHPPCRLWGRLRHFARAREPAAEQALGLLAVALVRQYGGVLEHPATSTLWATAGLPRPGAPADAAGGYTVGVWQSWFGHRATKPTWLYIVGCAPDHLPPLPFRLGEGTHIITSSSRQRARRPHVTQAEREQTPLGLALWLVAVARRTATDRARGL